MATVKKKDIISQVMVQAKRGIKVYRGTRRNKGEFISDPGDFGRGIYYSTSKSIAKCYGQVEESIIRFKNPFVMNYNEAYECVAEQWDTLHGSNKKRIRNAEQLTFDMLIAGYDGFVAVGVGMFDKKGIILEVVDYRSYKGMVS